MKLLVLLTALASLLTGCATQYALATRSAVPGRPAELRIFLPDQKFGEPNYPNIVLK